MSGSEHLSGADAAWLRMDRPTNLMVINSLLRFDQKLDLERLAGVIRTRLVGRYPRFSQLVVERPAVLGGTRWERDPHFDLDRHLHRRGLPAGDGETSLAELVGDLASAPLDRGKPLWDMYLVDGPGEGCAVIVRMHHCIADGIALARVMLSLTDPAGTPAPPAPAASEPRPPRDGRRPPAAFLARPVEALGGLVGAAAGTATGVAGALGSEAWETLRRPAHALDLAGELSADTRALLKLLFTPGEVPGVLRAELGVSRRVAWSRPLSLATIKTIARKHGATVNDVLLAALSGALREHLISSGEAPHDVRTFVPYNLRDLGRPVPRELGNHFGLVFLDLPVAEGGRARRLGELKRRMDEIKSSPEGPVSYALLEAIGFTPPQVESVLIDIFTSKASAVTTNVRGPGETVVLAGTPMRSVLVWAPTAGSVGLSVSIFSYAGKVTVGLLAHAELMPEPESTLALLDSELSELRALPARPAQSSRNSPSR